jgi:hypothetical protein
MLRKTLWLALLAALPLTAGADTPQTQPKLSAAAIVEKNVAARGGLQAWRAVQTMTLSGLMGAGGNQRSTLNLPPSQAPPTSSRSEQAVKLPTRPKNEAQLPITIYMARGRKVRVELQFRGDTALQVYDGTNGWKLRPYLNRRVVESFTDEERKASADQQELDGPLVDYAAKGSKVELAGTEKVEGRDNYKIKVTFKNGDSKNVWIDAETFLETKVEGTPRRLDGTYHPVETYYRDYRNVNGLRVPFVLETRVLPVAKTATGLRDTPVPPEKMVFDKIVVNPKLEASLFAKPEVMQTSVTKPAPMAMAK